jgi:dTDP-4-dehydrorhamnose 3,5-epimerase
MAVVQEAFENERISADVEMSLPQAFVDYIKRMIEVFVEVLKRGKALREAFDAGALPSEFEAFLAETTGVADQTVVDRSREKTAQEVAPEMANYSIGALGDDNPYKHPRGADGKYKGAPKWVNAPNTRGGKDKAYMRLRERLYQLVKEGEAGRFWYEDSGRAVLRMFNNDVVEAEKFIELLAIYSPQATVEVNTYFALRAYIQRAVNAAKEDFAVKTGTQDDKAKAVLYDNQPWAGRKTDNFYKNIMYVLLKELPASEVAKLKLDAEVYEMLQKPVTVDMWVYRAFGFDSDALTDVAGTGAFGFAERELNLIAEELNASLPEGAAPYLPHQIQAMLWTSIKGRSETKEVKDLTEAQSMKAKDMVKVKNAQGKLVRVTQGEVFDVAVDLRKNSPRFGQWVGCKLSAENASQLWIPPGFAHGFMVLSETAEFLYKTTDYWYPEFERSLLWSDPALGIDWPLPSGFQEPKLAAKDAAASPLSKAETF